MLGPKVKAWRSEKYRRFVASLGCFGCGIEGYSQCAHANRGRGLGQKACDSETFPLCAVRPGHMGCHQMHDLLIDMSLDDRREREEDYIYLMRSYAAEAGWRIPGTKEPDAATQMASAG